MASYHKRDRIFSAFTNAFFEDSGWYEMESSKVEPMYWGYSRLYFTRTGVRILQPRLQRGQFQRVLLDARRDFLHFRLHCGWKMLSRQHVDGGMLLCLSEIWLFQKIKRHGENETSHVDKLLWLLFRKIGKVHAKQHRIVWIRGIINIPMQKSCLRCVGKNNNCDCWWPTINLFIGSTSKLY